MATSAAGDDRGNQLRISAERGPSTRGRKLELSRSERRRRWFRAALEHQQRPPLLPDVHRQLDEHKHIASREPTGGRDGHVPTRRGVVAAQRRQPFDLWRGAPDQHHGLPRCVRRPSDFHNYESSKRGYFPPDHGARFPDGDYAVLTAGTDAWRGGREHAWRNWRSRHPSATPLVVPGKIPQMRHLCQGPPTVLVGCSNAPGTCSRHRAAVSCSVGYTNHTRERIARIGPPSIDQDLRR